MYSIIRVVWSVHSTASFKGLICKEREWSLFPRKMLSYRKNGGGPNILNISTYSLQTMQHFLSLCIFYFYLFIFISTVPTGVFTYIYILVGLWIFQLTVVYICLSIFSLSSNVCSVSFGLHFIENNLNSYPFMYGQLY